MSAKKYPPIQPGTQVITIQSSSVLREDWSDKGWASKKWGSKGVVISHHDSHGLCYEVKHEDGTEGVYAPSELEVVEPHTYLLTAEAKWTESHEDPRGKRPDVHTPKSRVLSVTFDAINETAARAEAGRLLAEFEGELPKKREGSLSWQDEDAVVTPTAFAMILNLKQ